MYGRVALNHPRRLLRPVSFSGRGLHTGEHSEVNVYPLDDGGPELEAEGAFSPLTLCAAEGAGRGTTVLLPGEEGRARTTEHLFAALFGLGLWSVRISLKGSEIPACGGCAKHFADSLFEASEPLGQAESARILKGALSPSLPLVITDDGRGSSISIFPRSAFRATYVIQYERCPIGTSMVLYDHGRDDFRECIAPARTFALASEVDELRSQGLAVGGSLDNAVVVGEASVQAMGGLRFPDEFARHKILDLMGDLYLLGAPLNAEVTAIRAGHAMHCRLVERLREKKGD